MSKYEKFTSPAGTCNWAYLNKPNTKFDADGKYEVTLVLSAKDAKPMMKQFDDWAAEVEAEYKEKHPKKDYVLKVPYAEEEEYDKEAKKATGKMTGNISFKFRSKNKPILLDSNVEKMVVAEKFFVPTGSTIKVAWSPNKYILASGMIGCAAYVNAVQILDLAEMEQGDFGFEKEEGGFSGDVVSAAADGSDFDFDKKAEAAV